MFKYSYNVNQGTCDSIINFYPIQAERIIAIDPSVTPAMAETMQNYCIC